MQVNAKVNKGTVVVADDDGMMREMLKLILREDGYSIAGEAHNGAEAITQCKKLKPDLILLDINMPKMDGMEALEILRKDCPKTEVIMVSAEATMHRVSEAVKKGAVGFVVKPLNAASVLGNIAACFKKK